MKWHQSESNTEQKGQKYFNNFILEFYCVYQRKEVSLICMRKMGLPTHRY